VEFAAEIGLGWLCVNGLKPTGVVRQPPTPRGPIPNHGSLCTCGTQLRWKADLSGRVRGLRRCSRGCKGGFTRPRLLSRSNADIAVSPWARWDSPRGILLPISQPRGKNGNPLLPMGHVLVFWLCGRREAELGQPQALSLGRRSSVALCLLRAAAPL